MRLFVNTRVITDHGHRWWGMQHNGRRLSLFLVLRTKERASKGQVAAPKPEADLKP